MSSSLRDEPCVASSRLDDPLPPAAPVCVEDTGEACTPRRFAGSRARLRRFVRREHERVSLRRMLVKAVLNGAVIPICFVASFTVTATLPPFMSIGPGHAPPPRALTEAEKESKRAEAKVKAYLVEYDCWTGAAPPDMEGKFPGHAVVTWPGDKMPVYGGVRAVTAGLEHYYEHKHAELQVHGFCR